MSDSIFENYFVEVIWDLGWLLSSSRVDYPFAFVRYLGVLAIQDRSSPGDATEVRGGDVFETLIKNVRYP